MTEREGLLELVVHLREASATFSAWFLDGVAPSFNCAIPAFLTKAADALQAAEERAVKAEADRDGNLRRVEECYQIAGKALGYPWFKDDQANFPGATEDHGVCAGEHVAETLVEELASRFQAANALLQEAAEGLERIKRRGGHCSICESPELNCDCASDGLHPSWEPDDPAAIAVATLTKIKDHLK